MSLDEPPTGCTCGVCDEIDTDGLEACAKCYGEVWARMVQFEESTGTSDSLKAVIEQLGIEIGASKKDINTPTEYTAHLKRNGVRRFGQGATKTEALATLFAKMLLRSDCLYSEMVKG